MPILPALINIQKSKRRKNIGAIKETNDVLFGTLLLTRQSVFYKMYAYLPLKPPWYSRHLSVVSQNMYIMEMINSSEVDLQNINLTGTRTCPLILCMDLTVPRIRFSRKHADGNMTLQMEIVQVKRAKKENAEITAIELKDKVYRFL